MSHFLVPISTCIFLYAFYALSMRQPVESKRFVASAIFASVMVGVITLLAANTFP